MRPIRTWALASMVIAASLLAGCGSRDDGPLAPAFPQADGQLSWQGVRECVDCDVVESRLTLSWAGDERRYQWSDTYFFAGEATPFGVEGAWRQEGGLVVLENENGSWHALRLLGDGRLQPRDPSGRGFAGGEAGMLVPMGADDVE